MGKKRTRKKYMSKGTHSLMTNGMKQALRAARPAIFTLENKIAAWQKGQNPWITVETAATNKRFIRVRAEEYWGKRK